MFNQILVPVDLTDKNQKALNIAVQMAELNGGRVTLIHVIKMISDATFDEFRDFYLDLEQQANQSMLTLAQTVGEKAADIRQVAVYGDRVEEIMRYADEQGVDLIVLNSHKINLDNPTTGWGTISYKVGILAQCPVLLVK